MDSTTENRKIRNERGVNLNRLAYYQKLLLNLARWECLRRIASRIDGAETPLGVIG
jgi:hypothetical protein